ncbi:MAG: hypothetical protein C4533_02840 [Candidatus Omnitrophota bacterium]|jgi:hypothetical protein|nr:MAG: hypothetical protein C4533_02840 [Candidatus Omnitrophota bacterium]
MDKKDIYEHLAKIYLDASSKRKKKDTRYIRFKALFFVSLCFVFILGTTLIVGVLKEKPNKSELALLLSVDAAKINFNFNPAKKETFTINLNKLNLGRYKAVAFSVKKATYDNKISLRVDLGNNFNERSEVYLRDIPHKWKEYVLNFSEFKSISDWSEMKDIAFSVEQWNAEKDSGVIYIDNIRFLR